MHKFHRCSHSPTWSTRSHAACRTAPLSPPFSPFRVRLRKGARDPSPRCKLLSAFYTSRNRIWVNSAKIEIPPSPLSSPPPAGRSGSRSRPPSRQPSQRVTVRPPKSRRKGTSAAPTEIKMPACLCIPGSPPSSPSFCRRRRHVNERECAPGFSISRHVGVRGHRRREEVKSRCRCRNSRRVMMASARARSDKKSSLPILPSSTRNEGGERHPPTIIKKRGVAEQSRGG